jgi:hypothetical protein
MRALLSVTAFVISLGGAIAHAQNAPYQVVEGWARLPTGIQWGQVSAVSPDAQGNIWAFQRVDPPIIRFGPSGQVLGSFGNGMFVQAHGLFVDRDGNIWVTDAQGKDGKGHQVFKFSPEGRILMTLGKPGVAGDGPDTFNGPTDVAIAVNGDIFVSDGHGNSRVVKFSKDGAFVKAWGRRGSAPGEFDTPHTIAIDSRGRVFVGDRANDRIQIFDQEGRFLEEWKQFGRATGIFIGSDDMIYVADDESGTPTRGSGAIRNPGMNTGFRIGSVRDGSLAVFVPGKTMQDVAPDPIGNVYVALLGGQMVTKYVKVTER